MRFFNICVYCYRVIELFVIKLVIQERKKKKRVKLMIVQAFNWLIRHLIYYLCIDKCSYMGQ